MRTHRAPTKPTTVKKFRYRGYFGRPAWCRLEVLPLPDGRTAVVATERRDNPGTSITNVAEYLASRVCDRFSIDPDRLVWIEHYGYPPPPGGTKPPKREYDRVTFTRLAQSPVRWSAAVLRHKPDGWPGVFEDPEWRPMQEGDWRELGLEPR